jgi:segregation and condensation protein A
MTGAAAAADPVDPPMGAGAGPPRLALDGFTGPLDDLLALARAQQIDLAKISLTDLVDQLAMALRQTPATLPLGQKGDWLVMAAWLVQLRSVLLLPGDASAQQGALAAAEHLRGQLAALQTAQALAGWLDRRPQFGHDVFARGRPELFEVSVEANQAIDGVEFLWASLALFDDEPEPETAPVYQPRPLNLYTVAAARDRIRQRLTEVPDGTSLERLLPEPPDTTESAGRAKLRRRSAWASTLVAGLELAKQGEVVMGQEGDFQPIHVAPGETPGSKP